MKNTTGNPENLLNFSSRESLLSANSELIANLQKRINVKRFRVQEGDSIKLAYVRVYIQALQAQNAILKDVELDEIKAELEELKRGYEMSILTIKKDIQALKQTAAFQKRNTEAELIENMTDDELREVINQNIKELGFNTYAEYIEAVKSFVLEKAPQTNMTNDIAIGNRFFELIEEFNIFEEFIQKYSRLGLTE